MKQPNIIVILNDDMVYPDIVASMVAAYAKWAKSCGVIPREVILKIEQ